MVTKKIFLKNTDEVLHLLGQQDENLRRLEQAYGVQIFVRQGRSSSDFSLVVRGSGGKVDRAVGELESLRGKNRETIHGITTTTTLEPDHLAANADTIYITYQGKHIKARTEHQKKYFSAVTTHDLVIGIGPAGTGKTFMSVAFALRALQLNQVNRIVLTRPVVEAGERLGFLPGDLYEKVNPYLRPLYDAFYVMLGPEKFRFMREEESIEIVPLAYMRGRTIDDAFIILDEAQNTTSEQMKMFLTRMGSDSQAIITGDVTQIDLEHRKQSGLVVADKILAGVEGVKTVRFTEEDVVRHELVKRIIRAYNDWEKKV